jgi:hypothetical protein
VAYIASRLISLTLDPDGHPYPFDTRPVLLLDGFRATSRRFDIRWPMKVLFDAWFVLMSISPRPIAYRLAEMFFFPDKRRPLNRFLSVMHTHASTERPVKPWDANDSAPGPPSPRHRPGLASGRLSGWRQP